MREFTTPALVAARQVGGLADAVFDNALKDPDYPALARRTPDGGWEDVTAAQFRDEVVALAKGMLAQGVRFGDRVAIMCRTRYEWTLFDFAIWAIGGQSVPVYPTSSAEQVFWMLHDAGVSACLVEHGDHAMTVGSVIDRLPRLARLWQLDAGAVAELMEDGAHLADDVVDTNRLSVTPDTPATIIYTSGTTGRPKGCLITHFQMMMECENVMETYDKPLRSKLGGEPSTLLFLPLAHVFGRMIEVGCIWGKAQLALQPDISSKALLPALQTFRPTFILAVPYVFEKIYDTARRVAESEGRTGPFDRAVEIAVRYAEAKEARSFGRGSGPSPALRMQHQLYDKLVYYRVRDALGGRVKYAISGGSPMRRRLGLFFEGVGITLFEGYGLTESTAAATANPPERPRYGTVGVPVPGTTVHIADDGEVWLRGPQIFSGYLNDPKATDAVLRDGWLATGDLGTLDEDGYLTITGRKKEALVTSSGKTVWPAALEERVRAHPLVAQCIVVGNDRPFVAALVTLDPEAVSHWLTMRGKPAMSPSQLVRDPDLETEVRRAVVAANTLVSQAESIRTFRILAAQFSEDHGLLTPSLKLKRKAIEQAYAGEIEALYRT
ncbi:AMP-dependent synthetase/ligase [Streptomyces sp. B1866]|uniref:AMP-dependent synthetase/ligase n=1 Tax=Streptomyces sp. B1866 TaxID=3075431 RepID=UPI00288CB29F|nr:AMP-dependent synthetase/ligase [Streptomyces sp. B1866]MDT3398735.1 AMP-dependent synthetase/ligase [Streptomyces sp. B1866]